MSVSLSPDPALREFSDFGLVLPGAKLHTYVSGSVNTPLATFSDGAGLVPNSNPIVASAGGLFGPIYLTEGVAYKYLLTDENDVTVPGYPRDPITVSGGAGGTLANHGVVLGTGTSTLGVTSAGLTGQVVAGNGPAADPIFQTIPEVLGNKTANVVLAGPASGGAANPSFRALVAADLPASALLGASLVLLKSNNGADTSTGATNVDTVAISGLTAKDRLLIHASLNVTGNTCAEIMLYSSTDSGKLVSLIGTSSFASNSYAVQAAWLSQDQAGATTYDGMASGGYSGAALNYAGHVLQFAATTAWTGAWTLALRHAGVTAGGTLHWSWSVYKVLGQ